MECLASDPVISEVVCLFATVPTISLQYPSLSLSLNNTCCTQGEARHVHPPLPYTRCIQAIF